MTCPMEPSSVWITAACDTTLTDSATDTTSSGTLRKRRSLTSMRTSATSTVRKPDSDTVRVYAPRDTGTNDA